MEKDKSQCGVTSASAQLALYVVRALTVVVEICDDRFRGHHIGRKSPFDAHTASEGNECSVAFT